MVLEWVPQSNPVLSLDWTGLDLEVRSNPTRKFELELLELQSNPQLPKNRPLDGDSSAHEVVNFVQLARLV